jgi:glycosyltransferase involved in cell wall biosynthesis
MAKTVIVVPCFNEAERLRAAVFRGFCSREPGIRFVFVNDGSTDATLDRLRELEESDPDRFGVVDQQPNQGKAEAVRNGMLAAFRSRPRFAGYWDADLATPLDEIPRFVQVMNERAICEMVFGARVQLLGRSIERNPLRHYLGRVFATAASLTLDLPVYDTQCGAKLFRVSPDIEALFAEPFCSGWIFDVEIIARLIDARRGSDLPQPTDVIYEIPLDRWQDVAGSRVRPLDFFRALFQIARIRRRYLKRR